MHTLLAMLMLLPAPLYSGAARVLRPKRTTVTQAVKQLGEPSADYTVWSKAGRADPFVSPQSEAAVRKAKRSANALELRVLEWEHPREPGRVQAVFLKGRLLYAVMPVNPSERTIAKLLERFTETPRTTKLKKRNREYVAYAFSQLRVTYIFDRSKKEFVLKIVR